MELFWNLAFENNSYKTGQLKQYNQILVTHEYKWESNEKGKCVTARRDFFQYRLSIFSMYFMIFLSSLVLFVKKMSIRKVLSSKKNHSKNRIINFYDICVKLFCIIDDKLRQRTTKCYYDLLRLHCAL